MGHLLGGWIAFEMGPALLAAGREVLSLIILDSEPPVEQSLPPDPEYSLNGVIASLLQTVELTTGHPVISMADLGAKAPARQREVLRRLLVEAGFLSVGATDDDMARLLRSFGTGLRARYNPQRVYPGSVRLVTTDRDCSANNSHGPMADGWTRWASHVVESRSTGNHMTMLKPPHARALAALVEKEIDQNEQPR
jgi:thioesterase domain-containing protein